MVQLSSKKTEEIGALHELELELAYKPTKDIILMNKTVITIPFLLIFTVATATIWVGLSFFPGVNNLHMR